MKMTEIKGQRDDDGLSGYTVVCEIHGDVTAEESNWTEAPYSASATQAALFRQRHLAKHLVQLAAEIEEASR